MREFRKKFLGLLLQRRLKYRYFLRVNMSLLCGLSLVCHDPQAAKKALLCINDTSILITLSTRYKMSGYSWVCVCKPRQGNSSRWLGLFMLNRLAAEVKNPCGDSQSAGNSRYCGPSLGCEAPWHQEVTLCCWETWLASSVLEWMCNRWPLCPWNLKHF